jgi:hypothetical protein
LARNGKQPKKIAKCYAKTTTDEKVENNEKQNTERLTAVWQNGGFSAKLNIWFSNKH